MLTQGPCLRHPSDRAETEIEMPQPIRFAMVLALLSVAPAKAGPVYLEATCTQSEQQGQLSTCDQHVTFEISVAGTSDIMGLRVEAPSGHCSRVGYGAVKYPYRTGLDVVAQSGFLRPNESEVLNLGRGWAVGTHEIRIIAIGVVEDCNVGQLHSWGINVEQMVIPE
jgi:hypothetical protein